MRSQQLAMRDRGMLSAAAGPIPVELAEGTVTMIMTVRQGLSVAAKTAINSIQKVLHLETGLTAVKSRIAAVQLQLQLLLQSQHCNIKKEQLQYQQVNGTPMKLPLGHVTQMTGTLIAVARPTNVAKGKATVTLTMTVQMDWFVAEIIVYDMPKDVLKVWTAVNLAQICEVECIQCAKDISSSVI